MPAPVTALFCRDLFGLSWNFNFVLDHRLPEINLELLQAFLSNPMKALQTVGMSLQADVFLPFGLGSSQFLGVVKPGYFQLEVSKEMRIAGLGFRVYLAVMYDLADLAASLAFGGDVTIPVVGEARLDGTMGINANVNLNFGQDVGADVDYWYTIKGNMDFQLFGFCAAGV